jgi:hypothetical protein
MESKEWCIRQGIWGVTDYRKEDASEEKRIACHYVRSKKVVYPLGLEIQKIHTCPNGCILYRSKEYENLDTCPVYRASWYRSGEMTLVMLRVTVNVLGRESLPR